MHNELLTSRGAISASVFTKPSSPSALLDAADPGGVFVQHNIKNYLVKKIHREQIEVAQ